jgi:proline iminopeptidase
MKTTATFIILLLIFACGNPQQEQTADALKNYFASDTSGVQTGGIKIVSIETPKGKFNIWTKRFGNNPKIKLLLLNGGPGATHEYFECFENFLPAEGIEFIYYDQLGCGNSDNPKDTALWDLPRYVQEVEQVRTSLGLNKDNFFLLGHSWGGILAAEYALKYQDNLKGLIISNMMMSSADYKKYADDVLAGTMPKEVLDTIRMIEAKGDFENPKYMELLMPNFYAQHICRIPMEQWPEPMMRSFGKMNNSLYVTMQGPSEFGISGKLVNWDRKNDLKNISVPVLVVGAKYDSMDPEHMKMVSESVQNGSYLYCPDGSHMCMYDDQKVYAGGLIKFLKGVDSGNKKVSM